MKVLRASKKLEEFELKELDVKSLITIPPDSWIEKRSNEFGYKQSFEKHGMIWPIAVTDHTQKWVQDRILPKNPQHKDNNGNLKPGYYVHVGNKRVVWAKENGYDKIEGYIVNTKEEKNIIHSRQHIQHTEIPK